MRNNRLLSVILIAVLLFVLLGGTQRASAGAFTSCASVTQIPVAECDALVALYNSTNLGSWVYIANNWLVTDTPGDWYGVTVANGHVEGLSLSAQYHGDVLVGSIPPELGSLANLKVLDLYDNQLSGSIPPELGNLANLQDLDLSSSQLSGIIPPELGNLVNLQDLNLSWNQLSGGIPTQLGNLAKLQYLFLHSNQLSGGIPAELGNLANLQTLLLSSNQLSGNIPIQLGSLTNLHYLSLSSNQLNGSIPPELGNLTELEEFLLSSNKLSGSIPPQLGTLANLQYLVLDGNQISGSIPTQLLGLTKLQHLILNSNQLSGGIPPEFGNLIELEDLELYGNELSGSIPPELDGLANLQTLWLSSNQLSGGIPPELGNLTSLLDLRLDSNQLSGDIPPELGNIIWLSNLNLSSNQLSGGIPPELGNIIWLSNLNLSSNQLSDGIPPELGNMTYLQSLDLHSNHLSGSIPVSFTTITYLTNFDATNTWLCEPHDAGFQAWKATVSSWSSPGLCYSISGQVTRPGGPLAGVTISDGGVHSTTSGADGAYTLADLPPHSYSLTPALPGFSFTPPMLSVTITDANLTGQDFHGTPLPNNYSISGKVTVGTDPLAGVMISAGGGHSTTSGADGSYSLTGLVPGDYTLTPSLTGRTFTPPTRSVTITNADVPGQDFSASLPNFSISGKVTVGTTPLEGVTVSVDSGHSTTSGADGTYTLDSLVPGDYTLTPSLTGYFFTPPTRSVTITNANLTALDFNAYLVFTDCASVTQIPEAECNALVTLYNSTNGAQWTNHTNWLVTATPGDWFGVTVTGGSVTEIDLITNQLSGGIPPELGRLAKLKYLDLAWNWLSGSIPPELGSLTNLESLNLDTTQLSGSIPLSFTALTKLTYFDATITLMCEAQDVAFQTWKSTVTEWKSPGLCYAVRGQVKIGANPLAGVTISTGVYSVTSGTDGAYTLLMLPGDYTLTPTLAGYNFIPPTRSVTITLADLPAQDFHVATNFSYFPLVQRH